MSNNTRQAPTAQTIEQRIEAAKGDALAIMRIPFAENQIGKLPRNLSKGDNNKFQCRQGTQASADGYFCGGYHARSIHLDYVGHAALTDRMLTADPTWTWEPLAINQATGLPMLDNQGGLWIRLTIGGVTRLGYGDSQGKTGPNAIKEAIGDALRNAGMRFGAALDLWHKGDLHDDSVDQGRTSPDAAEPAAPAPAEQRNWIAEGKAMKTSGEVVNLWREAKTMLAPQSEIIAELGEIARNLKAVEDQAAAGEVDQAQAAADAAIATEGQRTVRDGFGGGDSA